MDYLLAQRVTGRWGRIDGKIFTIIRPVLRFTFLRAFFFFWIIYESVFPLLSDLHLSFILYPFEHSFLFVLLTSLLSPWPPYVIL
jgi:hypothetical protein